MCLPLPAPRPRPLRPDPRVSALDGLLVGRELAKNLRLYEGEEVEVISPLGKDTPAGQVPRTRSFRVAGIFFTGMYEYDAKFVYASIPALQGFLGTDDEVSGIELKVSNIDKTRPLVARVQASLGDGYRVKDWQEINRSLFAALKLEQIAMFLVLTIITLVASFSIVSNLIMVVIEKAREIAILKAMGASDAAIMRVFVPRGSTSACSGPPSAWSWA
jgi:lipoprotein-releasing system permease protein